MELLVWTAGVDGLVLPHVAHEEHAVLLVKPGEEVVHLLRAREARLVDDVEVPARALLLAPGEMALKCGRVDARLLELVRRPGGRCKALDLEALPLGTLTDRS